MLPRKADGKLLRWRFIHPAGLNPFLPTVDHPVEEGPGGDNDAAAVKFLIIGSDPNHPIFADQQFLHQSLGYIKVRLVFQHLPHVAMILMHFRLAAGTSRGRSPGCIQHPELNPGCICSLPHLASEGVDFLD